MQNNEQSGGGLSSFRQQFQVGNEIQSTYSGGNHLKYLNVTPGYNDFRIFPSTIPGNSFIYLRHVHKLEVEQDGEGGIKELKRKHIFNSKTHGRTPKDIVDEYIAFVERQTKDQLSLQNLNGKAYEEALKQAMAPINDWKTGLVPEFKWCGYAVKLQYSTQVPIREISAERGTIDFAFSVGKKMDEIAASFDRRGAVSNIDPFSNPESGGILVVNYDKTKKPADMYGVSLDKDVQRPMTADDMAWLKEQRTLEDQYLLSYTRGDFNMAIEGLQRFDQKNGYNAFGNQAFLNICNEISAYYPMDEKVPMRDMSQTTTADPLGYKPQQTVEQTAPQGGSRHEQPASRHEQAGSRHEQPIGNQSLPGDQPQAPTAQSAVQFKPLQPVQTQQAPAQTVQPAQTQQAEAPLDERGQLLAYIQQQNYKILVHPQHSNNQIREFIEQEERLLSQQSVGSQPVQQEQAPQSAPGDVVNQVKSLF